MAHGICSLDRLRLIVLLLFLRVTHSIDEPSCSATDDSDACRAGRGALNDPEIVSTWLLHEAGLEVVLYQNRSGVLGWKSVSWRDGDADEKPMPCDTMTLGLLFEVRLKKSKRLIQSDSCTVATSMPINVSTTSLEALLTCPQGLRVHWRVVLRPITISGVEPEQDEVIAGAAARMEVILAGADKSAPERLSLLAMPDVGPCTKRQLKETGKVDGSPVVAQRRFFLAAEHPLAKHEMNSNTKRRGLFLDARVEHLGTRAWHASAVPSTDTGPLKLFRYTAVIGAFAEHTQARRVFQSYLSSVRLKTSWTGPLVHYNSWYDFTSWQDEGFFGPQSQAQARTGEQAKMLNKLLKGLRKDQMHEKSAIKVVKTYGEELVRKRGIPVDSFLWDDGWDDPEAGLWSFDAERFPRGFAPVAAVAKNYSCGNGVWLSPWGGYGGGKDRRMEAAKAQGYETNENGLSLAGPRYFERFKQAAVHFRREAGVNFFKFDGVAGDPSEVAAEIEAMLGISVELHTTGDGEVWINLTTGTWPSPFFLLWVDSIWRGHTDTKLVTQDMLPGALTNRQRWHAFRECIVYEFIVKRAEFFPLARLMIHGVVLAQHGDARANGLHEATELDWAQEVWSFASMGLLLQELYVSAELMTPERWDVLAEALAWVRLHSTTLLDTRWVFKAGCSDGSWPPHGWGAWRKDLGFLTLRNLDVGKRDMSPSFSLAEALELPEAARKRPSGEQRQWKVLVEKRLAPGEKAKPTPSCSFLTGSKILADGSCMLTSDKRTQVKLKGGELLILRVSLLTSTP